MTAKEFVDLYKGRKVRVITNAMDPQDREHVIGHVGIVCGLDGIESSLIKIEPSFNSISIFFLRELELIEREKVVPLPLPG